MKTVICPKCKQPITVTEGTEYIICCDEVLRVENNIKLDDPNTMKITFDSIRESLINASKIPKEYFTEEINGIHNNKIERKNNICR